MPQYDYADPSGHTTTVTHRMLYTTAVICTTCNAEMHRRPPTIAAVLWSDMRPSKGEYHPDFKRFIDTADERRDSFEEKLNERHRHKQRNGNDIPGEG